jgi:hypothetical protein
MNKNNQFSRLKNREQNVPDNISNVQKCYYYMLDYFKGNCIETNLWFETFHEDFKQIPNIILQRGKAKEFLELLITFYPKEEYND